MMGVKMGTFYSNNDYRNYLAHYGVKGMKWGVRRFRDSAKEKAYRALAGIYDLNTKTYSKLGNKTVAGMNRSAAKYARKKADAVQKEAPTRSKYRNHRGQLNWRGRKEQAIYSRAANSANKKADEWDAIYADSVKSHKQWLRRLHENGDGVASNLAETYKEQGFYKGREHEAARAHIKWHTREDLKDIRLADKARNQWRERARYYAETPVENFSPKERVEAIQLGNSRR